MHGDAENINIGAINKISERQVYYFSVAFLTGILSYPLSSFISEFLGIQSNIISIAARALTVLTSVSYLLFLIINRLFRPVPLFYFFLIFWIFLSVRIVFDTTSAAWQLGRHTYEYYLFGIVLSFFCTIPFYVPVKPDYRLIEKFAWIGLFILNILGTFNILKENIFLIDRFSANERFNPISFGHVAALLAITSFFWLLKPGRSLLLKTLAFAGIFIGILNLVLSASKSPLLFFFITIFLYVIWLWGKGKRKPMFFLLSSFGIIIAAFFALGLEDAFFYISLRLTEASSDDSSLERIDMLSNAWIQIKEQPFFGSFLEEKVYRQYPHNLMVEAFMTVGIIGGFFFLLFYFQTLKNVVLSLYKTSFSFISIYAFSHSIITLFSGSLIFSFEFWLAIAHVNSLMYPLLRTTKGMAITKDFSIKAVPDVQ